MKRIVVLVMMTALVLGLSGVSHAKGCECGQGMGAGMDMGGTRMEMGEHMMLERISALGLDDKQTSEIRAIHLRVKKEFIGKDAELKVAEVDLKEMLAKDPVDLKAVEAKVKEIGGIRSELQLLHVKALEAVKAKLTPEQRKKFVSMMEMHPKGGMMGGCGESGKCGMMGGMGKMGKCGMMRDMDDDHEMGPDDAPATPGMHQHH